MRKVHYHPSANIPHNDQYRSRQSNIKSHLKALCITIVYTWPVVAQFQQNVIFPTRVRTCSLISALIAMATITSDKAFDKIKINMTPLIQKIEKKIFAFFMAKEKMSL